eukprot:1159563-Pelagomonas_calceolata.AAC.4
MSEDTTCLKKGRTGHCVYALLGAYGSRLLVRCRTPKFSGPLVRRRTPKSSQCPWVGTLCPGCSASNPAGGLDVSLQGPVP